MIKYIGRPINNSSLFFETSTFEDFVTWIKSLQIYQLDTETNVTDSIVERQLKLVQFGDSRGLIQYVIDPRTLTTPQAKELVEILNNPYQIKIIQNASFEYQILKKYGIILSNIYDTMLMEKIIWCGYSVEPGFYSLKGLYKRYLFKELDKELQTSFDTDNFSVEQIFYAAQDVKELGGIRRLQIDSLRQANLLNVATLENEAVCGFSEIEYHGMRLDQSAWRANIDLADPVIEEAAKKLDEFLRSDDFRQGAIDKGFLSDKDSLKINWNSTLDKKKVFNYLFPDLQGITQPFIKKYIKNENPLQNNQASSSASRINLLEAYLLKDYSSIEHELLTNHEEFLISNQLLVRADTSSISWTSSKQALQIFQLVCPKLKSVSKEALSDCDHPIIEAYQEFLNTTKLKTTYGEEFINKYVDSDGRVRTHFNQILNTGRVSSSNPNCQNIPSKESLNGRYRNAFIADEGWLYVGSDYISQEAILVASFSGDKVWLDALANNYDLHSVSAEQVFGDKWKEGAEEDCIYYKIVEGKQLKQKCKCKKHKPLRTLTKTISFGLIYGMSKYKLSATAKISLEEAQKTIDEYFQAFPGIKGILDAFGNYGKRHGYIMTSKPFNRRRYYESWNNEYISEKELAIIDRASRNQVIQGTAAEITKLATCLIYWYIKDNNLWDKVKLVANIHDELQCNAREEYAEEWKIIMDSLMREAADFILPKGLLKADTDINKCWTK